MMTSSSLLTRPTSAFTNHQSTQNMSTFRNINLSTKHSVNNSTSDLLQTKRSFSLKDEQGNSFNNVYE